MTLQTKIGYIQRDLLIILSSMVVTVFAIRMGFLEHVLIRTQEQYIIGSFLSGIFFTSVFTIAPASAVLAKLSVLTSPVTVAWWGGIGAMFGDALLFLVVRDVFARDVTRFLRTHRHARMFSYFHFGFLKWLVPVIGAVIIASPLPDEVGLAMLGMSRAKLAFVLPLTFLLNFIGILLIGLLAVQI